jgi:DNA polymerase-3 subunit beta
MAQQDVRYYLNGMYLEIKDSRLRFVATDGHRLALCTAPSSVSTDDRSVIVPRKGILELARLLDGDGSVTLSMGSNHIRASTDQFTFTSKLVDGKFPEYERVLPRSPDKSVTGDRAELRQAFTRTAILSNEKYRGVRLSLTPGSLEITANNPEQEQAEEMVPVDYSGEALEVGFNVSYLLDVMGVLSGSKVRVSLSDSASSALIEDGDASDSDVGPEALYVVMPMRL